MNHPSQSETSTEHSVQQTHLTFDGHLNNSYIVIRKDIEHEIAYLKSAFHKIEIGLIFIRNKCEQKQNDHLKVQEQELTKLKNVLEKTIVILENNPCYFIIARQLRRDAEFVIRRISNPWMGRLINVFEKFLYASSTSTKVILGLALGLPIYIGIVYLPYQKIIVQPFLENIIQDSSSGTSTSSAELNKINRYDVNKTIALLVLSGVAGSLGSVISILSRVKDYNKEEYSDSLVPVMIGISKPLIGGAFGILLFTMISSGLLPLKVDDETQPLREFHALFTIAFIGGFSERLVKDVISQTENKILPPPENQTVSERLVKDVISQVEKKVSESSPDTVDIDATKNDIEVIDVQTLETNTSNHNQKYES
ncbi:MAG: hypothetical protein ACKO11_11080 [Cuspidothrix sp.]